MAEQSSCKGQGSNVRQWGNNLFFIIIRVMVVVNQILIMSPFIYFKQSKGIFCKNNFPLRAVVTWKFRTHRLVTTLAILLFIFYAIFSPFMIKMAANLYASTRRHKDNIFITIAKFTMAADVLYWLLVMATHIWYRENIVKILNSLNELLLRFKQLGTNFVSLKIVLALVLKMSLTVYDFVLNLPYLFSAAYRLKTQSILAFLFTHYLEGLARIFELNIFTFILLFLSCSLRLEKILQDSHVTSCNLKMAQFINLQNHLLQLVDLFRRTFQFGIFLGILLCFITILSNIYAMLDFYVTTNHFYSTFIIYLLCLILELYSLILVVYLYERSQRKVKHLFLTREELNFLKKPNALSIVETDISWPRLSEFRLLGLFILNNEFALFIFTYSINFILIILEFEINKARQ